MDDCRGGLQRTRAVVAVAASGGAHRVGAGRAGAVAAAHGVMEFRLVDAKTYRGDHAVDGNVARAWLALEAVDAAGLAAALRHAARTFAGVGDATLSRALEVWCGVLRHRFGGRLRSLTDIMEKPTMLAETLQEWDEQKINEGREEGREEERARLRRLAERHFDAATANKLVHLINAVDDRPESS